MKKIDYNLECILLDGIIYPLGRAIEKNDIRQIKFQIGMAQAWISDFKRDYY